VHVAVGVGRPVVEDPLRVPGVGGDPALVDALLAPPRHPVFPYIPPKPSDFRLILTVGCSSLGSQAFLQIRSLQNESFFACCHSRIASGIESRLHDFFLVSFHLHF
jgi:hypothetical protein